MNLVDFSGIGFRYPNDVINLFVGGSQLTGTSLPGNSDLDYFGVYIEPQEIALGLDSDSHFVSNEGTPRGTANPDKVDVTLYSLRKWAGLAAKGNPSVLQFLFAPDTYCHWPWREILFHKTAFLAKSHANQFLGYANAQMSRLMNQRGGRDCNRPFLEEQFGYDTKYGMHIIRLLGEAIELMTDGTITYPRPNAAELINIRKGKHPLYALFDLANALEASLIQARDTSSLPDKVDRKRVSKIVSDTYMDYWRG